VEVAGPTGLEPATSCIYKNRPATSSGGSTIADSLPRRLPLKQGGAKVRRTILILFSVLVLSGRLDAQELRSVQHQVSSPISDARFEIVQSDIAAKWTFKLNRYTGRVYQIVHDKDENLLWEEMAVRQHPLLGPMANIKMTGNKPRFQIFTSGIAAKLTFLLDSQTGATWQLVESAAVKGTHLWQPVESALE